MKHLYLPIMGRLLCVVLIASVLLASTGCATILNGRYQKVILTTPKSSTVMIGRIEAEPIEGKYKLRRDGLAKQITIEKEGYKSENITVFPYKKSPLYIMSWIPFGVLYLLPPYFDRGPKAFDYDKSYNLASKMIKMPKRDSLSKEIKLNNVAVKLGSDDIKYRFFPSYRNYKNKEDKRIARIVGENEEIELENTIFTTLLNEVLKKQGYIDTTKKVLASSYGNNMLLNATVTDYTIHQVNSGIPFWSGMIYIDLTVKWEALDYYKKSVFELTTESSSGQFAFTSSEERLEATHLSIKDAMEFNLIKFMNNEQVKKLLHDKSEQQQEASFEDIFIPAAAVYATTLPEAVKASVTIKGKDGHGSGFIISENGYIVTNYHVVADTADLKVILNDQSEHPMKIVRISKFADLALLKVDIQHPAPFRINLSKDIEVATDIYAVGTPTSEDLSQTISKGIISGIRKADNGKLIQTDASINGGNSGGAIVNKEAVVLGVVSSKLTGFGIEGVAFGIPAYEIFDRLKIKIL